MHVSCKSVSDGERYAIIVLVVLLLLRGEAVAHVLVYVIATMTPKSPLVFHHLGFGRVDPVPL